MVAHRRAIVADRGASHDELVRKAVSERRGPLATQRARFVLHVVSAAGQLITVPRIGRRRRLREPQAVRVDQLVLVDIHERSRQLHVAVGAQLDIQLPEEIRLGVVDLRCPPTAGGDSERVREDGLHRVEALLRDPDACGVAGRTELDARRERAVVVTEVARDEEMQPVTDNRAAQ